jgi:DNA-binding CsgD family transcriptional regulator
MREDKWERYFSHLAEVYMRTEKHFAKLWKSRDELSFRSVRFSSWNVVLLYALGIIMGDVRLIDLNTKIYEIDSFTFEIMVYGIATLIFAFLPRRMILPVARTGAPLMLATLVIEAITQQQESFVLYLLYSFGNGIMLGGATFLFFYHLNNSERLLNIVVTSLYYVVCVELLWHVIGRDFFMYTVSWILTVFACVSMFLIKDGDMPKPRGDKGCESCEAHGSNPIGGPGMAAVFYCYFFYMIIDILYVYLVFESDVVTDNFFVVGSFIGISVCILIQLLMNRSVWQTWNVFLVCSLASVALLAVESPSVVGIGSALYGVAREVDYIAVVYLIAGAACLSGCIRYFRAFCILEFAIEFALQPAFDILFANVSDRYGQIFNLIALAIMIVCACVTMSIYPIMSRRIFDTDWVGDLSLFDSSKYEREYNKVASIQRDENLGLTPREKQIFTMLLTDVPQKQVAGMLKVSRGTYNYHVSNLYRKLDIQSRQELFLRYSPDTAPPETQS